MTRILVLSLFSVTQMRYKFSIFVSFLPTSSTFIYSILMRTTHKERLFLRVMSVFNEGHKKHFFYVLQITFFCTDCTAACLSTHLPVQITLPVISLNRMKLVDIDLFS